MPTYLRQRVSIKPQVRRGMLDRSIPRWKTAGSFGDQSYKLLLHCMYSKPPTVQFEQTVEIGSSPMRSTITNSQDVHTTVQSANTLSQNGKLYHSCNCRSPAQRSHGTAQTDASRRRIRKLPLNPSLMCMKCPHRPRCGSSACLLLFTPSSTP